MEQVISYEVCEVEMHEYFTSMRRPCSWCRLQSCSIDRNTSGDLGGRFPNHGRHLNSGIKVDSGFWSLRHDCFSFCLSGAFSGSF